MHATYDETLVKPGAAWGAVASMALCVAVLIASEFMPVSLLTPIAGDLGITEGQAGQAISISGLFAVVTSLFIAGLTRSIDRKLVLTSFSLLLIVSGTIVTFAPNYAALMLGRALLGVAIGGFWSMSTAIVMRLLPEDAVPRGLAMLNAGNAVAATISAPLGSFLGDLIGWRGAFFFVVPLALLALVWQWIEHAVAAAAPAQGQGQCVPASAAPSGRPGHDVDPPAVHGAVRALHLSPAVPRSRLGLFGLGALAGPPADGTGGCRGHLVHQPPARHAPLLDRHRHSPGDGRDRRPADRHGLHAAARCPPARRLGLLRHRRAGGLGHVAEPRPARRRRGRRRPAGRRHPVRHHDRRRRRRPAVRLGGLVELLRPRRRSCCLDRRWPPSQPGSTGSARYEARTPHAIRAEPLLGAALASAAMPRLAFGQTATDRGTGGTIMQIRIAFADHEFTATLYDNPSARDFASMLPLDLTIDDYAHNEKIAYLPRKLTQEGSGPFSNERPGDLCYYAPWGTWRSSTTAIAIRAG